jgi:hypothetical protein
MNKYYPEWKGGKKYGQQAITLCSAGRRWRSKGDRER